MPGIFVASFPEIIATPQQAKAFIGEGTPFIYSTPECCIEGFRLGDRALITSIDPVEPAEAVDLSNPPAFEPHSCCESEPEAPKTLAASLIAAAAQPDPFQLTDQEIKAIAERIVLATAYHPGRTIYPALRDAVIKELIRLRDREAE